MDFFSDISIWVVIWLLLSGALLYFLGWTLLILHTQKKAWRAYAKKNKLRYRSDRMFAPPELSGPVGDYTVNLFTGEHMSADQRSRRKLTATEVQLSSNMPVSGGVASGGMVQILQGLGLKEETTPEHPKWDKPYIAACDSRAVLDEYLTPERLDVLMELMAIKNGWVIFVFKGETTLLRFDTPEPLSTDKKLDLIIRKMIKAAKVLELQSGESARLKGAESRKPKKQATIAVEENLETGGLQLEDDEPAEQEPPAKKEKPAKKAKPEEAQDLSADEKPSTKKS